MIILKKIWPIIAIAAAFLIGQLSVPRTDKDLIRKFADEKKALLLNIENLKAGLVARDEAGLRLREKATKDSLNFSVQLKAKDGQIKRLIKHMDNVNTIHYNAAALDSAISRLYPSN